MKRTKLYEADDKMIELIRDNYAVLQGLGAFGISLGFGDKTVREVCQEQEVDCHTFLVVVNFIINRYAPQKHDDAISVRTLLTYLQASHRYFLDFQLPSIRAKLVDALNLKDERRVHKDVVATGREGTLGAFILRIYDEYARSIVVHMKYEEKTLFPYVEALLRGDQMADYNIEIFSKHHGDTTGKLLELKNVIIKYLPDDGLANNKLTATLYDIYNNEEWLSNHSNVEDEIFVPAIRDMEERIKNAEVSARISNMINGKAANVKTDQGELSDREKDIIVCLVQGMSNKEIAEHLFISLNTVLTHRRNIARKLQIHSPAGLTIYAIVNNLVDIKAL